MKDNNQIKNNKSNEDNNLNNQCHQMKYDDINDTINIYNPQQELVERLNKKQNNECKNSVTWKNNDIELFINNDSTKHLENFNKNTFPNLYKLKNKPLNEFHNKMFSNQINNLGNDFNNFDLNNEELKNKPLYEIYNKMSNNEIKKLANDFNNFDGSFKGNEYTNYLNLEQINKC